MRHLRILILLLMALPLSMYAKLGVFLQPGLSLFSDTLGYDIRAGATVFYLTPELGLGGSILLSGATSQGTTSFNLALSADVSYDLYLYFLPKIPLVASPSFSLGWAYGSLSNPSYGYSRKMGLLLAPRAELSYVINETMRAGLTFGYELYLYDVTVSFIQVGLHYSYYFGVHKLNKDALIGDNHEEIL